MPPEAYHGKVWISKHYPFDTKMDFWNLDPHDVTRVVNNLNLYMQPSRAGELTLFDTNELLAALFRGVTMSNGMSPTELRKKMVSGDFNEIVIASEAGKAED